MLNMTAPSLPNENVSTYHTTYFYWAHNSHEDVAAYFPCGASGYSKWGKTRFYLKLLLAALVILAFCVAVYYAIVGYALLVMRLAAKMFPGKVTPKRFVVATAGLSITGFVTYILFLVAFTPSFWLDYWSQVPTLILVLTPILFHIVLVFLTMYGGSHKYSLQPVFSIWTSLGWLRELFLISMCFSTSWLVFSPRDYVAINVEVCLLYFAQTFSHLSVFVFLRTAWIIVRVQKFIIVKDYKYRVGVVKKGRNGWVEMMDKPAEQSACEEPKHQADELPEKKPIDLFY